MGDWSLWKRPLSAATNVSCGSKVDVRGYRPEHFALSASHEILRAWHSFRRSASSSLKAPRLAPRTETWVFERTRAATARAPCLYLVYTVFVAGRCTQLGNPCLYLACGGHLRRACIGCYYAATDPLPSTRFELLQSRPLERALTDTRLPRHCSSLTRPDRCATSSLHPWNAVLNCSCLPLRRATSSHILRSQLRGKSSL